MPVGETSSDVRALHVQISDALWEQVRSGALAVGERLPGENELMEQFGTSRGTVRRALKTLNDNGIVQTFQGRGTFVVSGRPVPSIGQKLVGLSEVFSYSDKSMRTEVLDQRIVKAREVSRSHAQVSPDEDLLYLDRVRLLGGIPAARMRNWVRVSLAPGIESADFESTSLFAELDRLSTQRVSTGRRTFEAVNPDDDVAASLSVSATAPLLFLKQISYLDDGNPIEWSDVWMDSKHIAISMMLQR